LFAYLKFSRFDKTPTCDGQTDGHKAIAYTALAQLRAAKMQPASLGAKFRLRPSAWCCCNCSRRSIFKRPFAEILQHNSLQCSSRPRRALLPIADLGLTLVSPVVIVVLYQIISSSYRPLLHLVQRLNEPTACWVPHSNNPPLKDYWLC